MICLKSLRKKSNESGIVLLTVVIVSCVMMILVASALDFVKRASDQSYKSYYKQQAYVTAQTTLDAFVGQIDGNANKDTIEHLENLAGSNAVVGVDLDDILAGTGNNAYEFGDCNISLSKNSNVIAITATSTYPGEPSKNGQTQSVTAYVKIDSKNVSQKLESALVTNGVDVPYHNNVHVRGGVTTQKFDGADSKKTWSLICNDDTYEGSCNFNGAMSIGNNFTFKDDPNKSLKGASITVTDFLFPGANNMKVVPRISNATIGTANKSNYLTPGGVYDDMEAAAVNYVNVYGALVDSTMGAGHLYIGTDNGGNPISRTDFYTSAILYGTSGLTSTTLYAKIKDSMNNDYAATPTEKGMDTIVSNFMNGSGNSRGDIKINGNLFCYASDRSELNYCKGDIYISNDTAYEIIIYGNAYVEGNIVLANGAKSGSFQVKGDLIVSPSSQLIVIDSTGATISSTPITAADFTIGSSPVKVDGAVSSAADMEGISTRNARPDPDTDSGTTQKYKYTAEQLLLNDVAAGDKGVVDYLANCKYTLGSSYENNSYTKVPETDVVVPCYKPDGSHDDKTMKFRHFQGQKFINIDQTGSGNLLIEVKDSDVIVFLSSISVNNMNIFVHNTSAPTSTEIDGETIEGHEHSCYIVSDSYLGGGSWDTNFNFSADKLTIMDYDIACHAGVFNGGSVPSEVKCDGGQIINNTDKSASDFGALSSHSAGEYYDLTSNSIIMIISSGTDSSHISFKTQNFAMINANIFAPNASFSLVNCNAKFKMVSKVTGDAEGIEHYGVLGQCIVNDFNPGSGGSNITTVEFYRANPSSVLSYVLHNDKSVNDDYTAYKVIGYSYKSNGIS